MKLQKLIAAIAASAAAVFLMAVNALAAQDASGLAGGTAYLNINNDRWEEFDARWNNTIVTGDGTYTVSMTADEEQNLALFNALEIVNGEVLFGRTYTVTIDSVKINGSEKKLADGYTCSADSKAVTTRVNIYNEWNFPEDKASDDGNIDCRSADGDFMSKSAKLISESDLLGVKTIEVKFTVKGAGSASGKGNTVSGEGNSASGAENTASDAENTDSGEENADSGVNDASSGASITADENPIDSDTASFVTGNVPAADTIAENASAVVMLYVMAAVGTASAVSRKRK